MFEVLWKAKQNDGRVGKDKTILDENTFYGDYTDGQSTKTRSISVPIDGVEANNFIRYQRTWPSKLKRPREILELESSIMFKPCGSIRSLCTREETCSWSTSSIPILWIRCEILQAPGGPLNVVNRKKRNPFWIYSDFLASAVCFIAGVTAIGATAVTAISISAVSMLRRIIV